MSDLLSILCTAAVSSAATLALGYYAFRRWVAPRLLDYLDTKIEQVAQRIQQEVMDGTVRGIESSGIQQQLECIGDQVKQGVLEGIDEAGIEKQLEEAMEEIEPRVKQGVLDGFTSLAKPSILRDTTLNVAEGGANLVEESLSILLNGLRSDKSRR
jgi:hypothetical protein